MFVEDFLVVKVGKDVVDFLLSFLEFEKEKEFVFLIFLLRE